MNTRVNASDSSRSLDVFLLDHGRKAQERIDRIHDFIPLLHTSFARISDLHADMEGASVKGGAQRVWGRLLYFDAAIASVVKTVYHVAMGAFFSLLSLFAFRTNSFLNQTAARQWEQMGLSFAAGTIGLVGLFSPALATDLNGKVVRTIVALSAAPGDSAKEARLFFVERASVIGERLALMKESLLLPVIRLLEKGEGSPIDKNEMISLIRQAKEQTNSCVREGEEALSFLFTRQGENKLSLFEALLATLTKQPPTGVITAPLSLWKEKEVSFSQFHRSFFASIDQLEEIEGDSLARKLAPLLEREGVLLDREELFTLIRDLGEEILPFLYEFHQNGGVELYEDLKNEELRPHVLEEICRGLSCVREQFSAEIDQAERELVTWAEELSPEEIVSWAIEMRKEKARALERLADLTESQRQLFEQYHHSLAFLRVSMSSMRHLTEKAYPNRDHLALEVTTRLSYLETILPSLVSFLYSCVIALITSLAALFTLFQNKQIRELTIDRWMGASSSFVAIGIGIVGLFSPDLAVTLNKEAASSGFAFAVERWEEELEPDLQQALAEAKQNLGSAPHEKTAQIRVQQLRDRIDEKFARGKGGLCTRLFNLVISSEQETSALTLEDFGKAHQVSLVRALKNGTYHLLWGSCKTVEAAFCCFLAKQKNREMSFHWKKVGWSLIESMVWGLDQCSHSLGEKTRQFLFQTGVRLNTKQMLPRGMLPGKERIVSYFARCHLFVQKIAHSQAEQLRERFVTFVKNPFQEEEVQPSLSRKAIDILTRLTK